MPRVKNHDCSGVPVVPGCEMVEDLEQAHKEADRIGYPLLVKARAGGGGRGFAA